MLLPNIGIVAGLILIGWLLQRWHLRREERGACGRNATMRLLLARDDRRQSPEAKPTGEKIAARRLHADGCQEQADDGKHHQD